MLTLIAMPMVSVKSNMLLNGINTVSAILFPIVTFPYAARVLFPDGIGTVNFQLSIINYIVLLTSLGIPLYAVKEVAKYRNDKVTRDRIVVEIILLSTILCLLGYIAVWFLAKYVPKIHQQESLFYILSLTIFFTAISVNWFYQGVENFKFITYRAIAIRLLATASLFVFVKERSDLLIYGLITVGSTVGNNFVNFIHLRKYLDFSLIQMKELRVFHHLKPAIHIFILSLIVSLYVQLNSIMLGFMQGNDAVGYFTAGSKISHVGLTLISSFGTVLLPRCSYLLQIGDSEGFSSIINKSVRLTVALSLPMTLGLMILAKPITMLFCGPEFVDAIPVLYLNAPVIILIGLTNVMGIQILYPKNKVNIVILSVSAGAIVNILLNILLIPRYSSTGAAIATLIAELTVLIVQAICGRKYYPFKMSVLFNPKYIIATIIMGIVVFATTLIIEDQTSQLIMGIAIGAMVYASVLWLLKEDLIRETLLFIKQK